MPEEPDEVGRHVRAELWTGDPVSPVTPASLSGVVMVTGTGTGVGKTTVTAALAAAALAEGKRVGVVKPVQTGVGAGEPGDIAEIRRLLASLPLEQAARLTTHEFVRLPDPLAPQAAARRSGVRLPPLADHAARIAALADAVDLLLVEGAGGLLVRLDGVDRAGGTLADLALLLSAGAVIVTSAELGTLNATELTVEALDRRGVPVIGLVIGCWPHEPGAAELDNRDDLPRLTGMPLLGWLPEVTSLPPQLVAEVDAAPVSPPVTLSAAETLGAADIAIRPWRPEDDLAELVRVSLAADQLFAEMGLDLPSDESPDLLLSAEHVLVAGSPPVGFAVLNTVDGHAHLAELSVHPAHGRQGIGGRLLEAGCRLAGELGHSTITLTTFVDVPWNAPWYEARGFGVLPVGEWGPQLRAVWAGEAAMGIAVAPRMAMFRRLSAARPGPGPLEVV